MKEQPRLAKLALAALGASLALGYPSTEVRPAPPEAPPLRVAVAPVADRRVLTFPDQLPLYVQEPWWTLTAQPRRIPDQVRKRMVKVLSDLEGLTVVEAPQLYAAPTPEALRAVAERHRLDAVFIGAVTVGYGQMQPRAFSRRTYVGRVQVALDVVSGRTGRPLAPRLILEGTDETNVNFRRQWDYDTLHHSGAGPEVRERTEWAVREVGKRLKEKISAPWLAAVLAEEGRVADAATRAQVAVERVALEPPSPRVGQTAQMVITYRLSGLEPGSAVSVTETRRLVREGELVAGPFQAVHKLGNGLHTSVQDLHVPPDAAAGLYTLVGSVEAAGVLAEGSGSFNVPGR